jgi:hypothetical protein
MDKVLVGSYVVAKRGKGKPMGSKTSVWDEESIAGVVYKVAPRVYGKKCWPDHYTLDDFVQDAAMYIIRLHRENYFPTDRPNIDSIVYRLINGFFVMNKTAELGRRRTVSLDEAIVNSGDTGEITFKDMILSSEYHEDATLYGKSIIETIFEKMDFRPYKTKKYEYRGNIGGSEIILSQKMLAGLVFGGMTMRGILSVYGYGDVRNIGAHSQANYVYHKVYDTLEKIRNEFQKLDDKEKTEFVKYINLEIDGSPRAFV